MRADGRFEKGDPRINRKGRPRRSRAARELTLECRKLTTESLATARKLLADEEWARENGSAWAAIHRSVAERGFGKPLPSAELEPLAAADEAEETETAKNLANPEWVEKVTADLVQNYPASARGVLDALQRELGPREAAS